MPYFSRLTDIVTCSLTALLKDADDPQATLQEIIQEMQEGLSGAERSVKTARENQERLQNELAQARKQAAHFDEEAVNALENNDENAARTALYRKKEAMDLMAGLEQQVATAQSTYDALMTTYRALEARLAEARRKMSELGGTESDEESGAPFSQTARNMRQSEVEHELEEMKQRLHRS